MASSTCVPLPHAVCVCVEDITPFALRWLGCVIGFLFSFVSPAGYRVGSRKKSLGTSSRSFQGACCDREACIMLARHGRGDGGCSKSWRTAAEVVTTDKGRHHWSIRSRRSRWELLPHDSLDSFQTMTPLPSAHSPPQENQRMNFSSSTALFRGCMPSSKPLSGDPCSGGSASAQVWAIATHTPYYPAEKLTRSPPAPPSISTQSYHASALPAPPPPGRGEPRHRQQEGRHFQQACQGTTTAPRRGRHGRRHCREDDGGGAAP